MPTQSRDVTYKIGQELFHVGVNDDGSCELELYIVRVKRNKRYYATQKIKNVTWGKKSSKQGDFGWLDPIWHGFREQALVGRKFRNLETTKLQAWKAAERLVKEFMKDDPPEEQIVDERALQTIRRQISKLSPAAQKERAAKKC